MSTVVASIASTDDATITIKLSTEDLNAIKLETRLATSEENTYYPFAVLHMFGNEIANLTSADAIKVTNYTEDLVYKSGLQ